MTRALRHLPNLISLTRLLLAWPVVLLTANGRFAAAAGVFLLAGLSDGLDGFLAKRFGWRSTIGGVLDALADKLLVLSMLFVLVLIGLLPWWLLLAVLVRETIIGTGAAAYRWFIGPYTPAPTLISKFNTGFLLALILAVLAEQTPLGAWIPAIAVPLLQGVVLITLVISGAGYVREWSRRARGNYHV